MKSAFSCFLTLSFLLFWRWQGVKTQLTRQSSRKPIPGGYQALF